MNTSKFLPVLVFIQFLAGGVSVFSDGLGTSSAQFLSLNMTPRAEALSATLTAGGDDLSGLGVNPATLYRLKSSEVLMSEALLMEDIKFSYMAIARPMRWGTPSLDYMRLSYGDFDRTDRDGMKTGIQSPQESFVGLGWTSNGNLFPKEKFNFGGLLRYVVSDLGDASANAVCFNFGAVYNTAIENLSVGVAVNNLGTPLKYVRDSSLPPETFRAGLGYMTGNLRSLSSRLRLSLDGVIPRDGNGYLSGGAELQVLKSFSFQMGLNGAENREGRISFGLGVGLDSVYLNYSALPSSELGLSHRMSARLRFGDGIYKRLRVFSGKKMGKAGLETAINREPVQTSSASALTLSSAAMSSIAAVIPSQQSIQGSSDVVQISTAPEIKPKVPRPTLKRERTLEVFYEKAELAREKGDLDSAIMLHRKIYSQEPRYRDVPVKLAICLQGRGIRRYAKGSGHPEEYARAKEDFRDALRIFPQDETLKKLLKAAQEMERLTQGQGSGASIYGPESSTTHEQSN